MFVEFGSHHLRVPESVLSLRPALARYEGRRIVLGIRPEDMEDGALLREAPSEQMLTVTTDLREDMGAEVFVYFSVDAPPVRTTEVVEALEHEELAAIAERARREGVPFIARLERLTRAREGERIDLVVSSEHLHFFDPDSGLGIYEDGQV